MNGPLALVVGGGNVGVGVMLRQLRNAGYDVAMVTHHATQAQQLRKHGARVQLTGVSPSQLRLSPWTAVPAGERRCVTELVRTASLAVVAVRPHHLGEVAALLAPGLSRRRRPINVLVCDNRPAAGTLLARAVSHALGELGDSPHGFVGALLDQIATSSSDEDGPLVHVEPTGRLFLDAQALRADPPVLPGSLLVEDHQAYVRRKLFLFSAGHTAAAFLGGLRRHTLISDALADPLVADVVSHALCEARTGLERCYGSHFAGGEDAVRTHLARYADPDLADTVERVGRDPARKLARDDRVCGPACLALAAGVPTPALALVAAAGLCAYETGSGRPPVPQAVTPAAAAAAMSCVSGLAVGHPFVQSVAAAYVALSDRDLDGVLQDVPLSGGGVVAPRGAAHNRSGREWPR
jgi:mannitol-1-phosphate 5-dehydrogenase